MVLGGKLPGRVGRRRDYVRGGVVLRDGPASAFLGAYTGAVTTVLERLSEICLALPEAERVRGVVEHTFKVRGKMFALYVDGHHRDGRVAFWCKGAPDMQAVLVDSDADRFFVPPYVGQHGWIGVRLDVSDVDWELAGDLLEESYRRTAPKRLSAQLRG